jgi:hypothetical protein
VRERVVHAYVNASACTLLPRAAAYVIAVIKLGEIIDG